MAVSIKIEDHSADWLRKEEIRLQKGLRNMGIAIVKTAQIKRTPRRDGDLRESGHIEGMGNKISVVFGNERVRYALIQEETQFQHYTTPGTGPHYLKTTGNETVKQGLKKFL